jgi:hypothetical protein
MRKLGASASASADSITEAYHPRQQPEVHVGYSKPGLFADLPVKTEHCRKRGQAVPSVLELGRAARMKRSVIPEELLGSDEMPSFYAPVKKQNFTLKKRALMDDTDMTVCTTAIVIHCCDLLMKASEAINLFTSRMRVKLNRSLSSEKH